MQSVFRVSALFILSHINWYLRPPVRRCIILLQLRSDCVSDLWFYRAIIATTCLILSPRHTIAHSVVTALT